MSLSCPHCGETVESADQLEAGELPEIGVADDGSISVYGDNRTYYRCRKCRKAMGIGHS